MARSVPLTQEASSAHCRRIRLTGDCARLVGSLRLRAKRGYTNDASEKWTRMKDELRDIEMKRINGMILLLLASAGMCLSQNRDAIFQAAFFVNGDSTDVRVIEVYVEGDGRTGSLKEVVLNSWFFFIEEWSTDAGNLKVKKTGNNTFQLHTSSETGLCLVGQFFTFEMGLWGDLYSLFEITGTMVTVYEAGPNKGKITNNNYMPIRLSDNRSDYVKTLRISLPGYSME